MRNCGRMALWGGLLAAALLAGCPGKDQDDSARPQAPRPDAAPSGEQPKALTTGGAPSNDPGSWPQFRGPDRDAIAHDAAGLFRTWPEGGPKQLWRIDGLADGYSGAAICNGKVYFSDYDKATDRWLMRCVSLADGRGIWHWSYERRIPRSHGITRTVPVANDSRVVSLDPKCVLHCFDAADGKQLWQKNLVTEYGTAIPTWYNGQCPLIEGNRVIIGVGGRKKPVLMSAFRLSDGEPLWETPNVAGHPMSHPSVMPMTLGGKRQYVWCTLRGLVGVGADGELLWERIWPKADTEGDWRPKVAAAPSSVPIGDGRIFQTAGYKAGTAMLRINGRTADVLFTRTPDQINSDTQTPILYKEHLFFVHDKNEFVCMDLEGHEVWRSPKGTRFGLGSYLLADGMLFIMEGDGGHLNLVEASTAGWKPLARARVLDGGHEAWAPLALVNGKLILRDLHTMVCLQVGPQAQP